MATVVVEIVKPINPPKFFHLTLSIEEAMVITKLCGRVRGTSQFKKIAGEIYHKLSNADRELNELCMDQDMCLDTIDASNVRMPSEVNS